MAKCPPLPREFYDRDPVLVAPELLGKLLVRRAAEGFAAGRIVETEAYVARDDPANHAHRGRTRRNASMFGPPGRAYVYAIHSRWCLNAVTEPAGTASAVLIRSIEPLLGIELMQARRSARAHSDGDAPPASPRDLARGPARLCEALAIDRALDGWDLTRGERLWIAEPPAGGGPAARIVRARRVGVTLAHDLPLRFFLDDCAFVSKPGLR